MNGDERERVGRVYASYGADPATQRRWSGENLGNQAIRDELVAAAWSLAGAELERATDILDVGCGTGWWLERLARDPRVDARLHGIEILPERREAAARRVPTAAIVSGDATALARGLRADVVTLFTVLSSLRDETAASGAIASARSVLRPGGVLLIWELRLPNPRNPHTVRVTRRLLRETLNGLSVSMRTTTLLPPLARRLGAATAPLYGPLTRIPALRTHRLVCARELSRSLTQPQR